MAPDTEDEGENFEGEPSKTEKVANRDKDNSVGNVDQQLSGSGGGYLEDALEEINKLCHSPEKIPEEAANYFFQTAAPRPNVQITGFCTSTAFICWYLLSSSAIFVALFWYLYFGTCTLITTSIDVAQSSDSYQNLFADGNTYFCTSKMITYFGIYGLGGAGTCGNQYLYECMLTGFTPDDFQSHSLCPPSNMKKAFTDDIALAAQYQGNYQLYEGQKYALVDWAAYTTNCPIPSYCNAVPPEAQDFLGFDGKCLPEPNHWSNYYYPLSINYGAPTASLTYVTCDPISSTLATAGQYTLYAQVLIIGFYLLYRKISLEGFVALTQTETYLDLWENDKVILEG